MKMSVSIDDSLLAREAESKISVFFREMDIPKSNKKGDLRLIITQRGMVAEFTYDGNIKADSAMFSDLIEDLLTSGK